MSVIMSGQGVRVLTTRLVASSATRRATSAPTLGLGNGRLTSASYATTQYKDKKQYRKDKTEASVSTVASAAAAAAAAITLHYYKDEKKDVAAAESRPKKKEVSGKENNVKVENHHKHHVHHKPLSEHHKPHSELHGHHHHHHHGHNGHGRHDHHSHHGSHSSQRGHKHHTKEEEQAWEDENTMEEIIHEENRVREFSMPDQVFKYFAGYQVIDKNGHKSIMMSPKEFYSAVTPDSNLSHAAGEGVYVEVQENELSEIMTTLDPMPDPDNDSVLNAMGNLGLLSYADFYFLLTLLSTPTRYIDTAFQLFDVTGEGHICAKEFAYVTTYMTYRSGGFGDLRMPTGIYSEAHQDDILDSNSGLMCYLFGTDRKGRVSKLEFHEFHSNLLDEVIELLFYEYDPKHTGWISELDFCEFLLEHAKLTHKKKKEMMKRVRKKWPRKHHGVSLKEFKNIYHVLAGGVDLERALFYTDLNHKGINIEDFKKIASYVSEHPPTPHVAEVMFLLLDDNGDGRLYQDTLHPVLFEWRHSRGFDKSAVHILMGHLKV